MKKSLFIILLAASMVLLVYGCSVAPDHTVTTQCPTTTDANSTTFPITTAPPETTEETLPWSPLGEYISVYKNFMSTPEAPNHNYEINRQVLPETVENPDNLPVLKWVCMVGAKNKEWNEAAVVELNRMLADRNLPYRVQFTLLSISGYPYPWDLSTNPEIQKELEDADLIYGYYTYREMEQWLMPITDHIYADAKPALSGALPDPLSWFSMEANGEIYGIPQRVSQGNCQGWSVGADFMEKFDLTVEDFNREFWEMDELFAKIYEKNGNEPFLHDDFFGHYAGVDLPDGVSPLIPMASTFTSSAYQEICMCFSIDLQAEKPTVVNVLETERFSKVYNAARRYLDAGYMTPESGCAVSYSQLLHSAEPYRGEWLGQEYYYIPCTPLIVPKLYFTYMTGISENTAYQEQALSLLDQIITDDDLRLQLCFGKEGRDYTLDGNVYSLITQEDGSRYFMDFLSPQATFFEFVGADAETTGMVTSTKNPVTVKGEGMTRLESYKEHLAQMSFSYCPVVFDYSVVEDTILALEQVLKDYYPMYEDRYSEYYEEYYPKMIEDLEEAGMSTVIAEFQRQLDTWIAEHPDWNPLERS